MKKIYSLIVAILLSGIISFGQKISKENVYNHISFLAHDDLKGRGTSTEDEIHAAKYIAQQFEKYGLHPLGNDEYYYHFSFKKSNNPHGDDSIAVAETRYGLNVIGMIDNGAPHSIVIGAHYDHLGLGHDHNSLDANPEDKIHNGADDNASGTAGVIELARYFSENEVSNNYNYIFMAFSGEELGLIGSKKWCDDPTYPLQKINYMLNMDMIGRLNDSSKKLLIYGVGTSDSWIPALENVNTYFSVKYDSAGIGPSDQTSFYLKDIPVLHFFTGQHSDYHKPSDDIEYVNFDGEVKVLELMLDLIQYLDAKPKLNFYKTKSNEGDKVSFKVTLGVMPDYVYEGKGMRIDGVTDGKPAQKGGIEKGDVIVQFGDDKIESVQDYMKALSKYKKGDKVKIIVNRAGNNIEKVIEL